MEHFPEFLSVSLDYTPYSLTQSIDIRPFHHFFSFFLSFLLLEAPLIKSRTSRNIGKYSWELKQYMIEKSSFFSSFRSQQNKIFWRDKSWVCELAHNETHEVVSLHTPDRFHVYFNLKFSCMDFSGALMSLLKWWCSCCLWIYTISMLFQEQNKLQSNVFQFLCKQHRKSF